MMSSDSKGKNVKSLLGYFMINTKSRQGSNNLCGIHSINCNLK